jgi:hypothetical protein
VDNTSAKLHSTLDDELKLTDALIDFGHRIPASLTESARKLGRTADGWLRCDCDVGEAIPS